MNILLDFDGIILRNDKIGKIIEQKSINFVHERLNSSYSKSKYINKYLYKTYGHTANGVAVYTSEKQEDVILDYNNFVFNNIDYKHISSYLTKNDKQRVDMLSHQTKVCNHKYGLFTNAPLTWCENLFYHLELDLYEIIDNNKVFTSDEGTLKPSKLVYENIENNLDDTIHFIDDSYINLLPVKDNNNWKTYLINSDATLDLINRIEKIHNKEQLNLERS